MYIFPDSSDQFFCSSKDLSTRTRAGLKHLSPNRKDMRQTYILVPDEKNSEKNLILRQRRCKSDHRIRSTPSPTASDTWREININRNNKNNKSNCTKLIFSCSSGSRDVLHLVTYCHLRLSFPPGVKKHTF